MTPFGRKIRTLRESRGVNLQDMSTALGVSTSYLSALEHGRRGRPSRTRIRILPTEKVKGLLAALKER